MHFIGILDSGGGFADCESSGGDKKIEGSVQILPNSGTLPCLVGT